MFKKAFTASVILTFTLLKTYSQDSFKSGYFIQNNGERVDCLIKDADWDGSPMKLEYKLSGDQSIKTIKIENITQFGIETTAKYIKKNVQVDVSSDAVSNLTTSKESSFVSKELLLQILVEGNATLFTAMDKGIRRYFLQIGEGDIENLILKKYMVDEDKMAVRHVYRQQLQRLNCETINSQYLSKVGLYRSDLTKTLIRYYECSDEEFIRYAKKKEFEASISIKSGLSLSTFSVLNSPNDLVDDFDLKNQINPRFGFEFQYTIPTNNNKWAVIFEPTFQSFLANTTVTLQPNTRAEREADAEIQYQSIELLFGVRRFLFINGKPNIFINLGIVVDASLNSELSVDDANTSLQNVEIPTTNNLAIGVGYNPTEKIGIELRYFTNRPLFRGSNSGSIGWSGKYQALSFIVGYRIFDTK